MRYELRKVFSFLDYIMGGLQLNCSVAIDFTGKDGLLFMKLVVGYVLCFGLYILQSCQNKLLFYI
jgi:hypothetical protein